MCLKEIACKLSGRQKFGDRKRQLPSMRHRRLGKLTQSHHGFASGHKTQITVE